MSIKALDYTQDVSLVSNIPVKVPIRGSGTREYVLCILNGKRADDYDNERSARIIRDEEGEFLRMERLAELRPLLISYCLKTTDGKEVPVEEIGTFPAPVQNDLFEKAKFINGMGTEAQATNAIVEIFNREGSPVDVKKTRNWLQSQLKETPDDKQIQLLQLLFKEDDEEQLGNSQGDMTDGSE